MEVVDGKGEGVGVVDEAVEGDGENTDVGERLTL